jgi:hypothetical protein
MRCLPRAGTYRSPRRISLPPPERFADVTLRMRIYSRMTACLGLLLSSGRVWRAACGDCWDFFIQTARDRVAANALAPPALALAGLGKHGARYGSRFGPSSLYPSSSGLCAAAVLLCRCYALFPIWTSSIRVGRGRSLATPACCGSAGLPTLRTIISIHSAFWTQYRNLCHSGTGTVYLPDGQVYPRWRRVTAMPRDTIDIYYRATAAITRCVSSRWFPARAARRYPRASHNSLR